MKRTVTLEEHDWNNVCISLMMTVDVTRSMMPRIVGDPKAIEDLRKNCDDIERVVTSIRLQTDTAN